MAATAFAHVKHELTSLLMPNPLNNLVAQLPNDALPDPEPAAPSLPEPDPGVFHHEPAPPAKSTPTQ